MRSPLRGDRSQARAARDRDRRHPGRRRNAAAHAARRPPPAARGAGGAQRLTRLVGAGRTRELVYSGRLMGADEALDLGIIERVLPPKGVLPTAVEDARRFAHGPRRALAAAKAAIAAAVTTPGGPGIQAEREAFLALFGTADQREGMAAFLEKREPRFGG